MHYNACWSVPWPTRPWPIPPTQHAYWTLPPPQHAGWTRAQTQPRPAQRWSTRPWPTLPPQHEARPKHPPHRDLPQTDLKAGHEQSRPEKCSDQLEDVPEQPIPALMRVPGGKPCPEQQSTQQQCTQHIRQLCTTTHAVLRYDTVPTNNSQSLIPTITHPGKLGYHPHPNVQAGLEQTPHPDLPHDEQHPRPGQ